MNGNNYGVSFVSRCLLELRDIKYKVINSKNSCYRPCKVLVMFFKTSPHFHVSSFTSQKKNIE